jgi:hypothetical protein
MNAVLIPERMTERTYSPPYKSLELTPCVSFGSDAPARMNKGDCACSAGRLNPM